MSPLHSRRPNPWCLSILMSFMMRFILLLRFILVRPSGSGRSIQTYLLFFAQSTIAFYRNLPSLREPWTLMKLLDLKEKQVPWTNRCHNRTINNNSSSSSISSQSLLLRNKSWTKWCKRTGIIQTLLFQMSKSTSQTRCPKTIYKLLRKDQIKSCKKLPRKSLTINLANKFKHKISWQWFRAWTLTKLDTWPTMRSIRLTLFCSHHSLFSTAAKLTDWKTRHTSLQKLTLIRKSNWTKLKQPTKTLSMNMIKLWSRLEN